MPKFLTISPTHIPGKKPYAWEKFRGGNYVAIGWSELGDLTGLSIEQVVSEIRRHHFESEINAISTFTKFLALEIGDIVAVNNVNFGLFGVGEVTSGYKFKLGMHDTGSEGDDEEFYSHYLEVKWLVTDYKRKEDLLRIDEKLWKPYGTTGTLEQDVPDFIKRLLKMPVSDKPKPDEVIQPDFLKTVIDYIAILKKDAAHKERAHESLVEDFLCSLGYEKHKHIKYRQGRLDVSIYDDDRVVLLFEVKRDWQLDYETHMKDVKQAYLYSLEKGIRFIILTNGDYYALFDRLKGLSIESNLVGYFQLSQLEREDLKFIDRLKKSNLFKTDIKELFINLSESFQ